jgi:hypothetical protein
MLQPVCRPDLKTDWSNALEWIGGRCVWGWMRVMNSCEGRSGKLFKINGLQGSVAPCLPKGDQDATGR